jgi:hypothetical protein
MEVRMDYYILFLLISSFGFFYFLTMLFGGTEEAYRDYLLTIALFHFVLSKLVTFKKEEN